MIADSNNRLGHAQTAGVTEATKSKLVVGSVMGSEWILRLQLEFFFHLPSEVEPVTEPMTAKGKIEV